MLHRIALIDRIEMEQLQKALHELLQQVGLETIEK
jgi:hypothetical protein